MRAPGAVRRQAVPCLSKAHTATPGPCAGNQCMPFCSRLRRGARSPLDGAPRSGVRQPACRAGSSAVAAAPAVSPVATRLFSATSLMKSVTMKAISAHGAA